MPDREKIIKALELCEIGYIDRCYGRDCPYYEQGCTESLKNDILALLKEQEAVTIKNKRTKEYGFGVYGGVCPKCHNWIQSAQSFCGFCGQAVKWK